MITQNSPEEPALNEFLCFAVYSAGHAFIRHYKPLLEEIGLTYTQFLTMMCLWREDGQTVGELGETLFLESSTLTPLLKRLEANGYLNRVRDGVDQRQVRINLTDTGKALRDRAIKIPACVFEGLTLPNEASAKLTSEIIEVRDALNAKARQGS